MLAHLPEFRLASRRSIRLPELRHVPVSERIAAIIDHPAMQRLRRVRQLGPTHLVYPGAVHTRFEHVIGVFDLARHYLVALDRDPLVSASLTEADINVCLLACLLHDIGHYPFAHSLEALHHKGQETARHEDIGARILRGQVPTLCGDSSLGGLIEQHFGVDVEEVCALMTQKPGSHERPERRLVATILSSGIDADKADYLERDSLHMGVSYGRHHDRARFLESLCASPEGDRIALTSKGKTAAETFVFCRYTMFSEAYWHHTVRAVSAMVERALADMQERDAMAPAALETLLLAHDDDGLLHLLRDRAPRESATAALLGALTAGRRSLHKRVLTLSRVAADLRLPAAYERVYGLRWPELDVLERLLLERVEREVGAVLPRHALLVDTPPRDKDRTETVQVVYEDGGQRRAYWLEEQSRVVQGIATDFVKVVKKIRIFIAADARDAIAARGRLPALREVLLDTILNFSPEQALQPRLI